MTSHLAVQLFTVREHTRTRTDLDRTLQRIRAIGYEAVELAAVGAMTGERPEVDASTARRMLDDHGLRCIAAHRSWNQLRSQPAAEIEFLQTLGCRYAAIGGLPDSAHDNYADYRAYVEEAEALLARLRPAGIRFGHHNHSHEFFRPEPKGISLFDILIDEAPADLMLELDMYWVANAGANPEQILGRCHGRVPVVHFKDKEVIPGSSETRIAPVGEGNLDWSGIIAGCRAAGTEWYCVEQDECLRDPFDCLKSSFEFLRGFDL